MTWHSIRHDLPEPLLETVPASLGRRLSELVPGDVPTGLPNRSHAINLVTTANVIAAAERLVAGIIDRSQTNEVDEACHYLLGPEAAKTRFRTPRNRKKLESWLSDQQPPTNHEISSVGSNHSLTASPRNMITLPRGQASRIHKVFLGYPLPTDPFPEDFTLTELCRDYPNHLLGNNLVPFMQAGWTASKIISLLPDQSNVYEGERVTLKAISSRLARLRNSLGVKGRFS